MERRDLFLGKPGGLFAPGVHGAYGESVGFSGNIPSVSLWGAPVFKRVPLFLPRCVRGFGQNIFGSAGGLNLGGGFREKSVLPLLGEIWAACGKGANIGCEKKYPPA